MRITRRLLALAAAALLGAAPAAAQVTTASIRGTVTDTAGRPLEGARITATHVPSGTVYTGASRADGRFTLPGLRVGGPYTVAAARIGYARQQRTDIATTLGVATELQFRLGATATTLTAVTVTSSQEGTMSSTRTGAATQVSRQALEQLPTISRRIDDFTRLTPQAGGSSFAGMDNRLNNIMVDGSFFNNSFGLAGQPGDRTGVAPISLDAIEQVQVSIAPYDVRQGSFVGAAVNTVTKSGTNDFQGSLYYLTRDNSDFFIGDHAADNVFRAGKFDYGQIGARLGGPIIRNKLFFFGSFETDETTEPGTNWRALRAGQTPGGTISRVRASSLDSLSTFLQSNFGYATGPYEGYDHEVPSMRFLGRVDYNLNESNKFLLRYTLLNSSTDVLLSNSSSLGFGNRRTRMEALNFQNSNYQIKENIRSIVGEWNSIIGSNKSNNLIVGYTSQDESRTSRGQMFPFVDILENGSTYTSFGFEPFTPNNELRYNSFQLQNNFTITGRKHDLTFGGALERYESENVFYSGSQSVYIYNSLADFYTDANGYLANPNRTTSPVTLRRFQVRYMNQPGLDKPVQPLEVLYGGLYAQDEYRATPNLTLTFGIRGDVPSFGKTAFRNPQVEGMTFRDENGNTVRYATDKLPDPKIHWSPRVGFNWDVTGDRVTQLRGGTGIFTGRPAYVWISNQIGANGVLTGFDEFNNVTTRPFHPDPNRYKPTGVPTGAPAASYELALTDPNFRFPQIWRSNLAVDRQLPWGLTGTAEFLYGRDVNGVYYIDANLSAPDGNFSGPDARPRWNVDDCPAISGTQQRLNCAVTSAIVLKNQSVGYSWNIATSLERSFRGGLFAKAAYSYGVSRNTVDPGSIALGSWQGNPHAGNPNDPGVGFSANALGHRFFTAVTYTKNLLPVGATGLSLFLEGRTIGNTSYTFSGDLNGDGGNANDLIYIPRDTTEMNFQPYTATVNGQTFSFTAAQQRAAWEAFIRQDPYLSERRGQYAERGAVFLPRVWRADFTLTQDIGTHFRGKSNRLQLRFDVLNLTNLLYDQWGVSQALTTNQPLIAQGADAQGRAQYRLAHRNGVLIDRTYQRTASALDVWRLQLGVRYTFD